MKIIGGSFGLKGTAYIHGTNGLAIVGAREAIYQADAIQSIAARIERERKFGILGCVVGMVLLSILLGMLLSVLGVVIAIVLAVAGSFYSEKRHIVDIGFTDGNTVSLECSKGAANRLAALRA